jgi:hypothetical protein
MDGVGKGLDPDFDFVSSAAPYIVEIKGAENYLKDEGTFLWGFFGSIIEIDEFLNTTDVSCFRPLYSQKVCR